MKLNNAVILFNVLPEQIPEQLTLNCCSLVIPYKILNKAQCSTIKHISDQHCLLYNRVYIQELFYNPEQYIKVQYSTVQTSTEQYSKV